MREGVPFRPALVPGAAKSSLHTLLPTQRFPHRHGEPRQHVAAGQRVGFTEHADFAAAAIDGDRASLGIDHPDQRTTGLQPVLRLRHDFAGPVVGRDDFDRNVRRPLKEPFHAARRDSLGTDKCHVGGPHRIGIVGDLEAGLRQRQSCPIGGVLRMPPTQGQYCLQFRNDRIRPATS